MSQSFLARVLLALLCAASIVRPAGAATPEMAMALRAGSAGIGLDYDIALGRHFSARVGYSGFAFHHSVSTSDVDYVGTLRPSMLSVLADWYAFHGGFHLTVGMVGDGTHLDVTARPASNGSYTINGNFYPAGELSTLTGRLKFGNTVSPYVGLGWGDPVGAHHHLHFLVDLGAIYGGTPNVSLTGSCSPVVPSVICAQLQSDVRTEALKLQQDVGIVQWYPVIDLGLAYRF